MSKFPWTRQLFRVNDYQDLETGKLYEFEVCLSHDALWSGPNSFGDLLTKLEPEGILMFLEHLTGWCKVIYKDMVGYLRQPKLFRIVEGVERVK